MTLAIAPPPSADSPFSALDPRAKLIAGIACAGIVATLTTVTGAAISLAVIAIALAIARLPARWVARRAVALAVAVAPFVLLMPLLQGLDGARYAMLLALKAFAIGAIMLVVTGTAPVSATAWAAASLGLPRRIVEIGMLTYRYLFVLNDEISRVRTAMQVRGFRAGTNGHTYRTAGHALGALFVRSAARADRVAQALRCRGSTGRFPVLDTPKFGWNDLFFVVAAIGLFIAILLIPG